MADHSINPYVGPRTFEEDDAPFFFGRDREARDLLALVISEPLVLFYAQSGAGKSSLINARLVPGMRQEGFVVLPVSRVGGELPEGITEVENVFVFNLLLSLNRGEGSDVNELTQTTISEYLQSRKERDIVDFQPITIADDNEEWEDDEEPARVLIIDQFEEIMTTHLSRWTERKAFFKQLSDAMRDDPLLWVVLALREDFVAALDPYARSLPSRLRARFHMERMGAAAARQAIERPAKHNGRPFAQGVARTLVDNLRQLRTNEPDKVLLGQYIEPVQLQVVCYQLWQNLKDRPSAPITREDVAQLGNVDAALSQFYEQAIANVLQETGISELILRNWFDRQLITEAETRGTVYQGKEETADLSNRIVYRLADQFLLRAEIRAGGTWFELVHDRFVSPILQANRAWRSQQSPLIRAAEEWDRSGRPRHKLFQGEQLKEALAGVNRESLEPIVQRFLTTSEDAQSQRDLEKTRDEMQEQRERAETEARAARLLRRLTIALVIIFAVAVAAAILATYESRQANRNEERAIENAAEAEANAQLAATREQEAHIHAEAEATSAAEALANAQLAEENANLAATREAEALANEQAAQEAQAEAEANAIEAKISEELAAEKAAEAAFLSRLSLAQSISSVAPRLVDRTNNIELATLLAVEAYHINRSLNVELLESVDDSLREILAEPYFNLVLEGHTDFVTQVVFNHNSTLLATADSGGNLLLWDLTEPDLPATSLEGHQASITAMIFSADDQWLATADHNGLILLWDVATWTSFRLEQHAKAVEHLAFTEENELVSAEATDLVYRWSLDGITDDGEVTSARISGLNSSHDFVGFSPDGTLLLTSNSFNTLSLWDLTLPGLAQVVLFFEGSEAEIISIAFSADMETLAAANAEGIVRIWDLTRNSTIPARIEPRDGLSQIVLAPDGRMLATISGKVEDLSVSLWDLSFFKDQRRIIPREGDSVQLLGHTSNIRNIAISSDGLQMASAGDDMTVRLWDLGSAPAAPMVLDGHGSSVTAVAVTPDESLAIAGNASGEILIWDMADVAQKSKDPLAIFRGHDDPVTDLLVTTDEQTLISAGADGVIQIWSLSPVDDSPQFMLNGDGGAVYTLALSPDGLTLASGSEDGLIRFWPLADILAGEEISFSSLAGHENWVEALAFSPNNEMLASGGGGATIFLWDLNQIQESGDLADLIPTRLSGHENDISSLEFSSDGHLLVSSSYDTSVRLWDTEHLDAPPH